MISAYQHLAATFTPVFQVGQDAKVYEHRRYAKPDESQADAIKRWRAAERRRATADDQRFPKFEPGVTTTSGYIGMFSLMAPYPLPIRHSPSHNNPAPFYVGPEVVDESEVAP